MSWDATLYDDRGHVEFDCNYTHNCNGMANAVIYEGYEQQSVFDEVFSPSHESWWKILNGMSGEDGAKFLTRIIDGLEADPERFRAMDPPNGWGSYERFLALLKRMRDSTPTDWPTRWEVSG